MNERILIIEDDEGIVRLLKRALTFENYQVDTASDGEGGLMIARNRPPDMVILDLMLPGIDGYDVCEKLRSVSNIPILMLTARETLDDRASGA